MQNGTNAQSQGTQDPGAQIRAQVRQEVRAIREQALAQARAARTQAEAARAQAQGGQAAAPTTAPTTPPPPVTGEQIRVEPGGPITIVKPPGSDPDLFIPRRAENIAIEFFVMIVAIFFVVPIARAFARRIERKPLPQALDAGLASQLQRIEHTVDSMAIEIERISEAQRYMARLQTERPDAAALPSQQAAS